MANWARGEALEPMELIPGADVDDWLVRIRAAEDRALDLTFSDGSSGHWWADSVILRDTILTRPLEDPAYF